MDRELQKQLMYGILYGANPDKIREILDEYEKKEQEKAGYQKELVTYVRDKKGNKIGCLIGKKINDHEVLAGWSAYSSKETIQFDKKVAKVIAKRRLGTIHIKSIGSRTFTDSMPITIRNNLRPFIKRCRKFFKLV